MGGVWGARKSRNSRLCGTENLTSRRTTPFPLIDFFAHPDRSLILPLMKRGREDGLITKFSHWLSQNGCSVSGVDLFWSQKKGFGAKASHATNEGSTLMQQLLPLCLDSSLDKYPLLLFSLLIDFVNFITSKVERIPYLAL